MEDTGIFEIAKRQRQLIALIGVYILGYILLMVLAMIVGSDTVIVVQVLAVILYIVTVVAYLYLIFKLAGAMELWAFVYFVLAFIPVVSLLAVLRLNTKATGKLKKNGIRVGLFGANEADILNAQAEASSVEAPHLPQCPSCGQPLKRSWNTCPKCGNVISKG